MVTIIMLVSRDTFLQRIFAQLELLLCDREQTNLFTIVDGDYSLFEKTRNFTVNSKFAQHLCIYRKRGQGNVGSVWRRRERIADIHNEVKQYINPCDSVFIIEDDTLFPTNALQQLNRTLNDSINVGIVTGIELGRWGYNHIGAWRLNDVYEPSTIQSIPVENGVQKIDACGLYCCVMRFKTYMDHQFKPFEDILGPDFDLGVGVRKQGYQNYVDHDIKCSHLTKKGVIDFNRLIQIVTFTKQENGKWAQGVNEVQ